MHTGDPHQAVQIAEDAVRDAAGIRSQRVRRTALEIVSPAVRHQKRDDVTGMLAALQTVGTAA